MFERKRVAVVFDDKNPKSKSKTKGCYKDECDINVLVKRYRKCGSLDPAVLTKKTPFFGDFTSITNFHDLANTVYDINRAFMTLSAEVRSKFKNDPHEALEFCADPKNHDLAREMGILPPLTNEEIRLREEAERLKKEELTQASTPPAPAG